MLDQNVDEKDSDTNGSRLKQARAMLDLFGSDCGRAAFTLDEIKEWPYALQDDQLRLRVERLVSRGESGCAIYCSSRAQPGVITR